MRTFLPFPSFDASVDVLDVRRLGKQRVEAVQVLRGLVVPGYGWRRHPAVRMWAGYEEALVRYGLEICGAWTAEGRADTCAITLVQDFGAWQPRGAPRTQEQLAADGDLPPWTRGATPRAVGRSPWPAVGSPRSDARSSATRGHPG
ncbi:MSMEG_6728 family protein [Streptomyces virginiae]|uniref:MSMEG_6728 family protein n=1 Tax=Streptomyces virginiae TaxID=1961 RepID=UPI002E2F4105|nr:MSMEG_6728 family protein [Streptomyces virginiae]